MPSVPPIDKIKEIKEASKETFSSAEELISYIEHNIQVQSESGSDHINLSDIQVINKDIIDEVKTKYKDTDYTVDIGMQEGSEDNVYSITLKW